MTKAPKPKIQYKRTHKGLRNISRLAQDIGRKSFHKHGFNGIEIFKQWPYIVGDHLSQYCIPDKINWPAARGGLQTDRELSATLVIRCLGAFALEVESAAPTILQRANIMFGYAAIGKIKIKQVQTLDFANKFIAEQPPEAPKTVLNSTKDVKDSNLRDALTALGAQIHKAEITKK
ncbi:MAG: DciA family protein [Hyphomicrobiales bacterium]